MIVAAVITLAALGLIFGGALAYASQKFAVKLIRKLKKHVNCWPVPTVVL